MRYGRLNADGGPGGGPVGAGLSPSAGFGDGAETAGDGALVIGGGSIEECDVGGLVGMIGSGSEGISSSTDDVSMVICLVGGAFWRSV